MSDDKQEKQAEETKSGSKSEGGTHEQPFGATKPSAPGETGTTPGSDWK